MIAPYKSMWTLATPFTNKPYAIALWLECFKQLRIPRNEFKLLWIDMTENSDISNLLKKYIETHKDEWAEIEYIKAPKKKFKTIVEHNYSTVDIARERTNSITETMNYINAHRKGHLLLWEDDIIVPKNAWRRLKSVFDQNEIFWGVTGVQYSRSPTRSNQILMWNFEQKQNNFKLVKIPDESEREFGVESVGAAASGFILYRDSFLSNYNFISEMAPYDFTGHDILAGFQINGLDKNQESKGHKLMLCWDMKFLHLGDDGKGNLRIFKSKMYKLNSLPSLTKKEFKASHDAAPRICIINHGEIEYSETFIQSHVDNIGENTFFIPGIKSLTKTPLRIFFKLFFNKSTSPKEALKEYLKKNYINLVLAEFGPVAVEVKDVCAELNIPLIAHFHGFDCSRKEVLDKYGNEYKDLFTKAAKIVVVSYQMQKKLIALGAPVDKIFYNPCGVNTDLFNRNEADRNPNNFLAVGRFVEKKSPQSTIKAFARVLKSNPKARLTMIGDGILIAKCKELVRTLRIEKEVCFMGVCSPQKVREEMSKASIFVQHSVTALNGDSEGTPVAILEAGAAGLPVVSTRHAGIVDVVIENETGILVNEKDIKAMAKAMIQLSQNPSLAKKLGEQARQRIVTYYSMGKSIQGLKDIIQQSLSDKII